MPYPPPARRLADLVKRNEVESTDGTYVTAHITMTVDELAEPVADLVMFMYQGVASAAPDSWGVGALVRPPAWARLLAVDEHGHRITLQGWIGEALGWAHEIADSKTLLAGRPSPPASWPAVDSISLIKCACSEVGAARAVQAKTSRGTARTECVAALSRFKTLQSGDYDAAWNEMLRFFSHQCDLEGLAFQAEDHFGVGPSHFAVSVLASRPGDDPVHDYADHVTAEPAGRILCLHVRPDFDKLSEAIAGMVEARLAGTDAP